LTHRASCTGWNVELPGLAGTDLRDLGECGRDLGECASDERRISLVWRVTTWEQRHPELTTATA
jgi:hypothetical protein